MVHVLFGTDHPSAGQAVEVKALTLGQLIEHLASQGFQTEGQRWFVKGQDAATLEGGATPVDEEDTVLITPW